MKPNEEKKYFKINHGSCYQIDATIADVKIVVSKFISDRCNQL
ncbi:hypothetical protein ACFPES_12610 [Paenibacillus sp. GCM10023248]|nr:hypothetical protein [Paenibacillus sp. MAHUQ-63]MDD9267870.1 hypothetical protein [Paenibacillus sp. MAHUQ-63]